MPTSAIRIVEVVVFRFMHDHPEVLVLRRSDDDTVYPGVWQVVTGTITEGESALDAARREVEEETALVPQRFWTVPYVGRFFDGSHDVVHLAPFFAVQVEAGQDPVLSAEHNDYAWLTTNEARKRIPIVGQQEALDAVSKAILRDLSGGALWLIR